MTRGIYVEIMIRAPMDVLWTHTQVPELHERWDVRFSRIHYLPKSHEHVVRLPHTLWTCRRSLRSIVVPSAYRLGDGVELRSVAFVARRRHRPVAGVWTRVRVSLPAPASREGA